MPRPFPVADALSKPFWDACNQRRLMVQYCTMCNRRQFPPQPACGQCGWQFHLTWIPTTGRGTIQGFGVTYDTRTRAWAEYQPFNNVVIALEDDPAIQFPSNLPGVPAGEVPIGAKVQVDWLEVTPGQLIPEWRIVTEEQPAAPRRPQRQR